MKHAPLIAWLCLAGIVAAEAALVSSGCAHIDPVAVTHDSMMLTGSTFETTANIMSDLQAQGLLKGADLARWKAFDAQFKASYRLSTALYDGAIGACAQAADAGVDCDASPATAAAGVVSNFAAELQAFQALIVTLTKPSGTGGGSS